MELLKTHRSIRKYKSDAIEDEVLHEILECGIRASNTGNMQLYSIIVTKCPEKKAALAPLHFNQSMVMDAPLLLTICFDFNRFFEWCRQNNAQTDFSNILWLLNGTIDSSILAQNICIAAENIGLGICYLGTTLYNTAEISEILRLPKDVIPITTLTIGYPDEIPELTDRLPVNSIIHFEEYHVYTNEEISKMYQEKENLDSSMKFIAENGKENLARAYTEVRYKSTDNVFFSKKLMKMFTEKGFKFN